jgi:hypothetical protein
VSWDRNSSFFEMIRDEISRISTRRWKPDDPLEPLSEVWIGLNTEFAEGQVLTGQEVGRLRTIIARRISNYFLSKGARRPRQPTLSLSDHPDIENVKSVLNPPDQVASERDLLALIDSTLSDMPPHRAEAVRSRFGYPGVSEWAELAQISGTTRQNLAKHARKGLEELKLRFA